MAPCFSGIASGKQAFSLRNEIFLQSVENALLDLTDCLERGSFPTLTTDRQGNLRVKVVLTGTDGVTAEQASQKIQQMLSGLVQKHDLTFPAQSPDFSPMPSDTDEDLLNYLRRPH